MTSKEAKAKGFTIARGAYHGTTDDRADRWYIVQDGKPIRKWIGYRTRQAALDALEIKLTLTELEKALDAQISRKGNEWIQKSLARIDELANKSYKDEDDNR